jgi:hypothetical protein
VPKVKEFSSPDDLLAGFSFFHRAIIARGAMEWWVRSVLA